MRSDCCTPSHPSHRWAARRPVQLTIVSALFTILLAMQFPIAFFDSLSRWPLDVASRDGDRPAMPGTETPAARNDRSVTYEQ